MKKRYISTVFICLAVALSLQFLGCSNLLSPQSEAKGNGTITVFFQTGAGRAALSPVAMNFDSYKFTFKDTGGAETVFDNVTNSSIGVSGGFEFTLTAGISYNLDIEAYAGTGPAKTLAAKGKAGPFKPDLTNTVNANLEGLLTAGGSGTFSWDISYPLDTKLDELQLYISGPDFDSLVWVETFDPPGGSATKKVAKGSKPNLPTGRYFFIVRLSKLNGETAGYANGVEIYPGQTTEYKGDFINENNLFKNPNIENTETTNVESWYGFNIKGVGAVPGNAAGTLIKTFNGVQNSAGASMGGPYKDVLKLTPPSAGYLYTSHIMTYRAPIDGTYTFSVWAYVDALSDAPVLHFNKTEWDSRTIAGGETPVALRTWVEIKTTVPAELDLDNYFGLIAGATYAIPGTGTSDGLKNKVIYLRDPKLEVEYEVKDEDGDGTGVFQNIVLVDNSLNAAPGTIKTFPETLFLYTKGSAQLVLSGDISGGSPVWSSSDPSVATVDQKGNVAAGWTTGKATITVTAGNIPSAKTQVTVSPKYIALTFDDGPDPEVTPTLLNYFTGPSRLKNGDGSDIHLSFFLVGARIANSTAQANLVTRMINEGHDIGNHTWDHAPAYFNEAESGFVPKTVDEYKANLFKTQLELWNIVKNMNPYPIGRALRFVRPAYLNSIANFYTASKALGLPTVGGTLINDWEREPEPVSTQTVYETAVASARPWGFLVFHDYHVGAPQYTELGKVWEGNGLNSIPAVPLVVEKLKEEGYKFVSVSEMIKLKNIYLDPENALIFSLGELSPANWEPAPTKSMTVSTASVSLTKTTPTATVTATAIRDSVDPDTAEIYWYSADSSIASVAGNDTTATITALKGGSTKVYAMSEGMMKEISVTVASGFETQLVTSITLSALSLNVGKTGTMTSTVAPTTASNKTLTWSSATTTVATINASTGLITAVAGGTSVITATATDGSGIKGTATVTVTVGYTVTYAHKSYTSSSRTTVGTLTYTFDSAVTLSTTGTGNMPTATGSGTYFSSVALSSPTVVSGTSNKQWTVTATTVWSSGVSSTSTATLTLGMGTGSNLTNVDKTTKTVSITRGS